jgi:16S rRNA (guanine527-N7)-methyltransferase
MLAFKSANVEIELNAAGKTITALGGQLDAVWNYTLPAAKDDFCLIAIAKSAPTPKEYPRSYSIISKKPAD